MTENEKKFERKERDPDIAGSEIALRRAAKQARELAKQKGTYIVIFRDGEIHEEKVGKDVA